MTKQKSFQIRLIGYCLICSAIAFYGMYNMAVGRQIDLETSKLVKQPIETQFVIEDVVKYPIITYKRLADILDTEGYDCRMTKGDNNYYICE